jgi:hypothetical protein
VSSSSSTDARFTIRPVTAIGMRYAISPN